MTSSATSARQPHLVLFRSVRPGLPAFLQDHLEEQLRTLRHFFDVTLVGATCDYDEVCDRLEPDLCVFESGIYAGERNISNTHTHPRTPKLGFLHADAFDSSRAAFVADMDRWGVGTFFTTSMAAADYTPEIADRLFVWPNTVDAAIYRGVEGPKTVPVLLTGSRARHYPWRNAMRRVLAENFTTLSTPHFGWSGEPGSERMPRGEAYARLLHSAVFVPTCGTMSRDLVRKHLEIPAAGACLVTEQTAAVEAAGFRDMVNCVFADADNAVDKLAGLMADGTTLESITKAGTAWVLDHHSAERRDQVLQWYRLASEFGPDFQIDQRWPDGSLSRPHHTSAGERPHVLVTGGLDRGYIAAGWKALRASEVGAARDSFMRALNFFFIPEAVVGMVFASLLAGDSRAAQEWVSRLLVTNFSHFHSPEPDPVYWACQLRVYLCQGDVRSAVDAAGRYPGIRHEELDRMRAAVYGAAGGSALEPTQARPRASIASVPALGLRPWEAELASMIAACSARLPRSGRPAKVIAAGLGRILGRSPVTALVTWQAAGRSTALPIRMLRARLAPLRRWATADPECDWLADFVEREHLGRAVLVGGGEPSVAARAVRRGLAANPTVESIDDLTLSALPAVGENSGELFVFVSPQGWALLPDDELLLKATTVVLSGLTERRAVDALEWLLDRAGFELLRHELHTRRGSSYAVLRKRLGTRGPTFSGGSE